MCIGLLLTISLSGCEGVSAENDLSHTLDALRSNSLENAYLYSSGDLLPQNDFTASQNENEVNLLIKKQSSFQIQRIEVDGDNATAYVTVSAPDVLQILEQQSAFIEGQDVTALLDLVQQELEQEDFPKKEFDITATLKQVDSHWYLMPNYDLNNALSGGLLERYAQIVQDRMEGWGNKQ